MRPSAKQGTPSLTSIFNRSPAWTVCGCWISCAEPFPQVRLLFEALKQRDVLIGIATTCQKDQLATYDKRMDILELTDGVACGEPVGDPCAQHA
jgi:phosphoglycolate phosphatase-like HAD superfamily hydrolase